MNNALWSRESLLLGNNVLLMAAMLVVLLGTLLPLVHKQLGLGSISVGEPFFNTMFTWLMVPFALLLGGGAAGALGPGPAGVTSGRCCSPPWSPPWCCRYCCHGCWKIKSSP
ncbi:Cytochrome c heme lyase subunit CcmF [Salmonella enterica subsp. enterica]|nr:Cytochrome c heme lyase subunit CcmF [Salmonella enterica subsp. enterica]